MQLNGVVVEPLSKEKKDTAWKKACADYVERVDAMLAAGHRHGAEIMAKHLLGGVCDKCSAPMERVTFDNMYMAGEYYKPACNCYPTCPRCRQDLAVEKVTGVLSASRGFCPNCRFPVTEEAEEAALDGCRNERSRAALEKYFQSYKRGER